MESRHPIRAKHAKIADISCTKTILKNEKFARSEKRTATLRF